MSLTLLPDDFLKTGDPARTWPHGKVHRRRLTSAPTLGLEANSDRAQSHEAWTDWLAHLGAGRLG
jgi:hypothetical protein